MKTFDGKVAPWYIALFAAMLMAIAGLYVWVVPGAGADQSFVAGLILIAAACCGVVTGAPIARNRVEVRVPAPGRPSEGSSESRGDSREGDEERDAVWSAEALAADVAEPCIDVVFGVVRTRIAVADIKTVERRRSLIVLGTQIAACSGDCVRIVTSSGGAIVVALKDNQGFVDLLQGLMQ